MPLDREKTLDRLLDLFATPGVPPMRKRAMAKALEIEDEDYLDFRHWIEEWVENGRIAELKHGKFGLPRPGKTTPGREAANAVQAGLATVAQADVRNLPKNARVGRIEIKRAGFGFLLSDPPGNDLFVSPEDLGGALTGDLVAVIPNRPTGPRHGSWRGGGRGGRPSGRVVKVLERAHTLIVGTFYSQRPSRYDPPEGPPGFVVPDTRGVFGEIDVMPSDKGEARDGDKVAIELIEARERNRPGPGQRPSGRIVTIYGEAGEARAEIDAIVQNFGLRVEFPDDVLAQAEAVPEVLPPAELAQRVDYTSPLTFTIDPPDAKDHDDAVALRHLPGGKIELLVHIADVAHYVTDDSPIDREARERATSVYLPGLTLPMLPPKLSGNMCSLKEGQLRLTQTCAITYSQNYHVERVRIERSYIRSAAFLTYDRVRDAVDSNDPSKVPSKEIFDTLKEMKRWAAGLRKKRLDNGSIDLDIPEVKLLLDERGAVSGVQKRESHWAHQLIEDMMLAANQAVAGYLIEHEIPGLYRIHEDPDEDAIENFIEFVQEFGVSVRPPYDRFKLKAILERVQDKEYRHAVQFALLTSFKQAHYSAECRPHYALAFSRYLHFTSPIRRYPDLVVHRALKERYEDGETALPEHGPKRKGGEHSKAYYAQVDGLRPLATHCSHRERQAAAAEEEVRRVRQIQYLQANQRESHPAVITGVRDFGIFVELQDLFVEGMVRIQDMADDYYEYFEAQHLLQGRRSHRSFRLGDKLTVRVLRIDIGQRRVYFGVAK